MFNGILISKDDAGYRAAVQQIDEAQLPDGDVTVRVDWSTLNYKDGLAITGKSPVVRKFPMVPGIDFAGTVTDSSHPEWKAGDRVVFGSVMRQPRTWSRRLLPARVPAASGPPPAQDGSHGSPQGAARPARDARPERGVRHGEQDERTGRNARLNLFLNLEQARILLRRRRRALRHIDAERGNSALSI